MKRVHSSDSLGALISDDQTQRSSQRYGRDYQTMLDEEGCMEECGQVSEKKRRLSVDQVKALEKNFEVENKLEPDRKARLAQELGLQPRQVAVWFQNRRARWKTKQLERDYRVLKANFDALKCSFDSVQRENEALANEIRELKSKFKEYTSESTAPIKKEPIVSESDAQLIDQASAKPLPMSSASASEQPNTGHNFECYNEDSSNSSAILNNEDSTGPNAASSSSLLHLTSAPATNSYHFSDPEIILGDAQRAYQPQFVKIEEHNFFSGDEACNFFSDDQAPTLQWYCSDQWS